jgi:PAS domain S-box-containing protein
LTDTPPRRERTPGPLRSSVVNIASISDNDARFRAIFTNAAVGIARVALDGRFLEVNDRLCDILGYASDELLTKTFGDITHRDDLATDVSGMKRMLGGGLETYLREKRYRRKDGSVVWANLTVSLSHKADGSPDYFISIIEDISARKQAEAHLRETDERLSLALQAAGLGIFEWDVQADRAVWENDRMYEIFGHTRGDGTLSKAELLKRSVLPDDADALERALAAGMASGRPFRTTYRIHRKDGALRWLDLAGHFLPPDGGPVRMIGVLTDNTEQHLAEESLRASEERFRIMADTAPVMIWTSGIDNLCDFFNKPWLDFTGRPLEAELGNGWTDGVHPEDLEYCLQTYVVCFETRKPFKMDYRLRRYDGQYRWIFDQGVPRFSSSGKFLGYIGSCVDVTERKQAEAEREKLAEEQAARAAAEAANRSKDEFLAMVSHELRSPLSAILSYAQLLRVGPINIDAINRVVTVIERNAKAQTQIIEDLLDSARITTGKLRIELTPIDLVPVLEAAVDTVRPAASAKAISLVLDDESKPTEALGDPARLQQIFWNLLTNAIKFTPEGGRVSVAMHRDAAQIRIIVSDTGQGIEPGFLPFVFQRFSQTDTSSARRVGGLGLGLALVKDLVELHGGTISAKSEGLGRGATFTVTFPARQTELVKSPPTEESSADILSDSTTSLKDVSVLVVDDEEDIRMALSDALGRYGAQVTAVASGPQALAALANSPGNRRPDVLIVDMSLQDEDGYALLKKVRAHQAEHREDDIPAIAVTGYGREEDRLRALEAGFRMHLTKPFDLEKLVQAIAFVTNTSGRRRLI